MTPPVFLPAMTTLRRPDPWGRPVGACLVGLLLTGGVFGADPAKTGPDQPAGNVAADATRGGMTTGAITGRVQHEVTGQYLTNARITVKGTDLTAFTDEFGIYRISRVPIGPQVLAVFYSGLDPIQLTVNVAAGQGVEQDFALTNRARYGADAGAVKLDPFVISSSKLTDGEALATNEQRFAANIKNVVATDAFGDVTEGNIVEFLKFLPGVTVGYEDGNLSPITASVRGFDPNLTTVSVDGEQLASTGRTSGSQSREFQFRQVSINNTSRIEVAKVPTPANPADALAGSINLVSKSAFERSRAQFNYRLYLAANSEALTLRKQPFPFEKKIFKTLPGFDFDYTLPVTRNFGLVLTALSSSQFQQNDMALKTYNAGGTGTGATFARPYLQSFQVFDIPSTNLRDSVSLRADWRVTPNSVLTVSAQNTYYHVEGAQQNFLFNAGTTGTPTIAGGVPLSFDEDTTIGATGRGSLTTTPKFVFISGVTLAGSAHYRYESSDWRIDGGINHSKSRTWRRYSEEGSFSQLNTTNLNPVRVVFDQVGPERPGIIRVFDNSNQEIDFRDLRNYRLTGATSNSYVDTIENIVTLGLNARRRLNFALFPLSLQVGGHQKRLVRDWRQQSFNWTYNSPTSDLTPVPYKSVVYGNQPNFFGLPNLPWVSPHLAFQAWQKNPALFTKTAAQEVAQARLLITTSEFIQEVVSAGYMQAEGRLLGNRLRVLTGVRFEQTADDGQGPLLTPSAVWARNADGSFVHNAAGARVRRPEAGAAGSMEELRLIAVERGNVGRRSYHGYYPSLHLTFNATENLLLRAAFARTYGRPNFDSVIPNASFDENDFTGDNPAAIPGNITIRNTGLKPWTANNYDLSAEYYTEQGGSFTAGLFRKDIRNFFGSIVKIATAADLEELGLDPRYAGWQINTKFNAGDARVSGAELSARQSLGFAPLPSWTRHFQVFANTTKLRLEGNQNASFNAFMPFSLNWGATYSRNPLTVIANWSHLGRQRTTAVAAMGPDAFIYIEPRTTLDLNCTYQLGRRVSLFANGRNVQNVPRNQSRAGSQTPDYARRHQPGYYGVQYSVGVKGTF